MSCHLYVDILDRFATQQRDAVARIRAFLEAGDRATAESAAHTLVGTSGVLGADPVGEAARAVETAISGGLGQANLEAPLAQLERTLHQLLLHLLPALQHGARHDPNVLTYTTDQSCTATVRQ